MKPEPTCLKCGKKLNDFTAMKRDTLPMSGDLSVCLYCNAVAVFTGNGLDLRPLTTDEAGEVADLSELKKAQLVVEAVHKKKSGP
jgi:hypothetical protein